MDAGKLVTLGLVGGVGYWLYRQYSEGTGLFAPAVQTPPAGGVVPSTTPPTPAPPTTTPPPTPTPAVIPPAATGLYQRWINYAVAQGLTGRTYTTDQWNFYFVAATGQPGPAPEDVGIDPRDRPLSYGEYIAMMTSWLASKGLTGYHRSGGNLRLAPNYLRRYR